MRGKATLFVAIAAFGVTAPARATISQVSTGHNLEYQQTGASTVGLVGGFFSADLTKTSDDSAPAGTLQYPGGTVALAPASMGSSDLHFQTPYLADQAALDNAYPVGPDNNYQFSLGAQVVSTTIPSAIYPAAVPQIANYDAFTTLDPSHSFTVDLTGSFEAAGTESFTFFTIRDDATNQTVFDAGFQPVGTVSFDIGAGTLMAGHDYSFEAIFDNRYSVLASDGVTPAFHLFDTRTFGSFALAAAAVPEPASWALMIGGFGIVGGALRRRRGGYASLTV